MKKRIIITTTMAMFIAFVAFGQDTEKKTKEKVNTAKKEMSDVDKSIDKAKNDTTINFQQFKRDTEKRLDKVDRTIAEIDTKVNAMSENDREKYAEKIKDLKEKNKDLRKKLDNYRDEDTGDKIEAFQEEFQKDMNTLDAALDDFFEDNKK